MPGNGCVPIRRCNWYAWLADRVESDLGLEVVLQDMPDPHVARSSVWLPLLAGKETVSRRSPGRPQEQVSLNCLQRDTVAIGHSSGAVALLRLLESHGRSLLESTGDSPPAEAPSLGCVALVGAYHSHLGDDNERKSGYFDADWDWGAVRAAKPVHGLHQFGGADDPFLPESEQDLVARESAAVYHKFDKSAGRGHFMDKEFPELFELIQQLVR